MQRRTLLKMFGIAPVIPLAVKLAPKVEPPPAVEEYPIGHMIIVPHDKADGRWVACGRIQGNPDWTVLRRVS